MSVSAVGSSLPYPAPRSFRLEPSVPTALSDAARNTSSQEPNIPGEATSVDDTQARRPELRKQFDKFVGTTFFGQMMEAMRKTVHEPAYFHGGRAEEIFREQLDQIVAERISEASASSFTTPMYELFSLGLGEDA